MCSGLENGALSGTFSRLGLNSDFLMSQMDGSLQMEHALLFTFLEVSPDCKFRDQLHSLQSHQIMWCRANDDDELQTDGNRSGHFQNGEPGEQAFLHPTDLSERGGFLSPFPIFAIVCFRGVMFFLLRNFTLAVG